MRTLILAAVILSTSSISHAREFYGKGYTIIEEATAPQNDLKQSIYKDISAYNVQEALNQILQGTGWRLADHASAEPELHRLYIQPYPTNKKRLGPMPLDKALVWVAGSAWQLVVDPVNKLISYELSENYSCFPSTKQMCPAP